MRKPEIRTIARTATRTNYDTLTDLAWRLFDSGVYADVNLINGDLVVLTHAATDEQLGAYGFLTSSTEKKSAIPVKDEAFYASDAWDEDGAYGIIGSSPAQTSVPGLTDAQAQDAYVAVSQSHNLNSAQRSKLDSDPRYQAILTAAHKREWGRVARLLFLSGIIS